MRLYEELQKAKTEEDVKDAYIKALGLKSFTKGLIDIQTKEIWLEAKHTGKYSTYGVFTQLLHYVQVALNKGEHIPPFLAAIDTEKAALMKTSDVLPFLEKKTIKWGKSASQFTQEALDEVSTHIGTHFVSFKISTHEAEFISTVKAAIKTGEIIRTQITPDNLKQVFDKWVAMIGCEISGVAEKDYALLFFSDIMSDGKVSTHTDLPAELLHRNDKPVFSLGGRLYELGSYEGYRRFWAIYHRPPKQEYRDYLLERRDSLIPIDERAFKGAFYTPLNVVDKAYDLLSQTLGKNWQKDYIVWDMCCGVGNLEVKHSNPRNVFMSTLDQADVDVMKATKTCVEARRFQYDYLNDDITDDGHIDYSITNKIPIELRNAISERKKILVLINPPYAEAAKHNNDSKKDVASTKILFIMDKYSYALRELFTQFIARISIEIPNATLAMFSKLKYISAPNFEKFREHWKAKYLDGFVVHSKAFDGIKGNFPIGFLIWDIAKNQSLIEIKTTVLDKNANPIGERLFYNVGKNKNLNSWLFRLKSNSKTIPLKNALSVQKNHAKVISWVNNAIGYMLCGGSDLQHANTMTAIFSSVFSNGNGFYITPDNLHKISIVFSARRLIKPTWLNDRDQFLQPDKELSEEFKNDCLIWMLFNGSNLTASANGLVWNDKTWSIVNKFIPFRASDVGSSERFESDFMVQCLSDKELSKEATSVLNAGRVLWQVYFAHKDEKSVREKFKLNRADVGWYQIRNALKARNASGDFAPVSFASFEACYKVLSDKLRPLVYEYGFLK